MKEVTIRAFDNCYECPHRKRIDYNNSQLIQCGLTGEADTDIQGMDHKMFYSDHKLSRCPYEAILKNDFVIRYDAKKGVKIYE